MTAEDVLDHFRWLQRNPAYPLVPATCAECRRIATALITLSTYMGGPHEK